MYRYQVSENVVAVRGKHDFKFGADYNAFNMRNNAFALALNGAYMFPTLEAFIQRQPLALRTELRPERLHRRRMRRCWKASGSTKSPRTCRIGSGRPRG